MTGSILLLCFALAVIGAVAYGGTVIFKAAVSSRWRKGTRIGRTLFVASPLLLGATLTVLPGVLWGLMTAFSAAGGTPFEEIPMVARAVLGLFAGTFATQIHHAVRKRIRETPETESGIARSVPSEEVDP
jgi:hypothetical protein